MTMIRDIIQRDIGVKIEGVVKVFDRAALATEIREYVVTDKIESELKRIFDTFTLASDALRRGGLARDVMGIWISGFFGSGKSHFAKVVGHLLQNTPLDGASGDETVDAFVKHLSDSQRGNDIRLRLAELKLNTQIRTIAFEINSRKSLTETSSIGEILLSELYRHTGLAENFVVARLERRVEQRGLLADLSAEYERTFGVAWASPEGRDDLMTVRRRLAQVLPKVAPTEYPDERTAKQALDDLFRHERLTAEGVADELTAWVDAQAAPQGKVAHLAFVVDEMGTFIGDSSERISELNSLAEMIGNKGKGKVWLIATSQQDLEKVVDRTNFQPALVGRLNARFELKPHLISDEIGKVVAERILKKRPSEEEQLRRLFRENEGPIAQLADLKASRRLGSLDERTFVDAYPFLPHQIVLAQEIFEHLAGFRLSGGVRSMIGVVMEVLQEVGDHDLGVLVSFDQIFDAVENDLLSQEFLGASGVRDIHESDQRVLGLPFARPSRVLKVLWLLQHAPWVPRVPETIAKLLATSVSTEIPPLRNLVERTLDALREAGYVSRDEATAEWKVLNERERTIEQVIQEMIRPGGPRSISMAAVRRASQQICKEELVTRKRLSNFAVSHGVSKVPFAYGVRLDGEAIETGPEIEVQFLSPLAPGRKQESEEIRQKNQAAGLKGRVIWWVADAPDLLQARVARYEALVKVTSDKRFVEDVSEDTKKALAEKRKERDDLRGALIRDLEAAFLKGALFYGGREIELQGEAGDLREVLTGPLTDLIQKAYPRFPMADRPIEFARQLKTLLNPASSALHAVAPELELFDTQNSLKRDAPLVSTVLDVLRDLADEGVEPTGALLLDARDRKGFQGFGRTPFGWPDEIVRLVLAACLRAGAVFIEQPSGTGPVRVYDYRGSDDSFSKINTFRRLAFHAAETALSVDQIKQASRALIALGMTGIPESGTALAGAVRELGLHLKSRLDEARLRQQQGVPIPDDVLGAESALTEAVTAKDPTQAVLAFLAEQDRWRALHQGIVALRTFLDANRHLDFEASRRLEELAATHPVPDSHGRVVELAHARRDMAALISNGEVLARWPDYRSAFESVFEAYRDVYLEAYETIRAAAESTATAIRVGASYVEAPADQREAVVEKVFGGGRVGHYPPLTLPTVRSLLEAAGRRSLSSLAEALVALPGYRAQVEAELRELSTPPPALSEKVFEWHPPDLLGRRFRKESEVDHALKEISEELNEIKKRVREGFTVVVK